MSDSVQHDSHLWEKVLWKRKDYADNHVPPELFLASLRKNRMSTKCDSMTGKLEHNRS